MGRITKLSDIRIGAMLEDDYRQRCVVTGFSFRVGYPCMIYTRRRDCVAFWDVDAVWTLPQLIARNFSKVPMYVNEKRMWLQMLQHAFDGVDQ